MPSHDTALEETPPAKNTWSHTYSPPISPCRLRHGNLDTAVRGHCWALCRHRHSDITTWSTLVGPSKEERLDVPVLVLHRRTRWWIDDRARVGQSCKIPSGLVWNGLPLGAVGAVGGSRAWVGWGGDVSSSVTERPDDPWGWPKPRGLWMCAFTKAVQRSFSRWTPRTVSLADRRRRRRHGTDCR